jgi:hypothetical protein
MREIEKLLYFVDAVVIMGSSEGDANKQKAHKMHWICHSMFCKK